MSLAVKLKFYYDYALGSIYPEGESPFHRDATKDVVKKFIDPLQLDKQSQIIDLGCGPGYFLDEMQQRGYCNVLGISLSEDDLNNCRSRGHRVQRQDMNFLPNRDESVDMLFCRHSLEHSPFPFFSLIEYNRVLKPQGVLYVEVPSADCDRPAEDNQNHFSILSRRMWLQLLKRTGFDVDWYDYEFPVKFGDDGESLMERYHIFVCRRRRPVDVK